MGTLRPLNVRTDFWDDQIAENGAGCNIYIASGVDVYCAKVSLDSQGGFIDVSCSNMYSILERDCFCFFVFYLQNTL